MMNLSLEPLSHAAVQRQLSSRLPSTTTRSASLSRDCGRMLSSFQNRHAMFHAADGRNENMYLYSLTCTRRTLGALGTGQRMGGASTPPHPISDFPPLRASEDPSPSFSGLLNTTFSRHCVLPRCSLFYNNRDDGSTLNLSGPGSY